MDYSIQDNNMPLDEFLERCRTIKALDKESSTTRTCALCLENIERCAYDDHIRGHGYEILNIGEPDSKKDSVTNHGKA
jgi:hypothetical protein